MPETLVNDTVDLYMSVCYYYFSLFIMFLWDSRRTFNGLERNVCICVCVYVCICVYVCRKDIKYIDKYIAYTYCSINSFIVTHKSDTSEWMTWECSYKSFIYPSIYLFTNQSFLSHPPTTQQIFLRLTISIHPQLFSFHNQKNQVVPYSTFKFYPQTIL